MNPHSFKLRRPYSIYLICQKLAKFSGVERLTHSMMYLISETYYYKNIIILTVNPLLAPPRGGGGYFFSRTFEGGLKRKGGLFHLAKRITCSKNTVVSDRVDLRVVQLKSLSKVFNSLVGAQK